MMQAKNQILKTASVVCGQSLMRLSCEVCSPVYTMRWMQLCRSMPKTVVLMPKTGSRCSCACTRAGRSAATLQSRSAISHLAQKQAFCRPTSRCVVDTPMDYLRPSEAHIVWCESVRLTTRVGAKQVLPACKCGQFLKKPMLKLMRPISVWKCFEHRALVDSTSIRHRLQ